MRHGLRRRYASSVIQASVIRAVCARVVLLPLLPEALNAAVPARHDACCTEGLAVNLRRTRRCFASIVIIFLFAWPTSLADCGRGRLFFGAQSHSGIAASLLRAPRCFSEAICALWGVNGLPARGHFIRCLFRASSHDLPRASLCPTAKSAHALQLVVHRHTAHSACRDLPSGPAEFSPLCQVCPKNAIYLLK